MSEEKTYSAKQVATRIGTEARTLRKFFRDSNSGYDAVGQGGRYDFAESELPKIKAAFDAWQKGRPTRSRPASPRTAEGRLADKAGITRTPRTRGVRKAPNPLEDDDLMTRTRHSIGERAAMHGVTVRQGHWVPVPGQRQKPQIEDDRPRTIMSNEEVLAHDAWQEEQEQLAALDEGPTDAEILSLDAQLDELDLDDDDL